MEETGRRSCLVQIEGQREVTLLGDFRRHRSQVHRGKPGPHPQRDAEAGMLVTTAGTYLAPTAWGFWRKLERYALEGETPGWATH